MKFNLGFVFFVFFFSGFKRVGAKTKLRLRAKRKKGVIQCVLRFVFVFDV